MDQGFRDKLMDEFDENIDEAQKDGGLFDCYAEPLREMYSAALNEIMVQSNTCTQHTQAKMPSFEDMRKSCIERGICSEDGFCTNYFDTGFKAAYNCIARHFGCA